MASAILDLTINEGETFDLDIQFWENVDETIPIDITSWTFDGGMKIGDRYIPMTFAITAPNLMTANIAYTDLKELSNKGKYDIDSLYGGNSYRVLQGVVRVDKEVSP